jgi:hypothetical protein
MLEGLTDPNPDPDPEGPKTYGSGSITLDQESHSKSGSLKTVVSYGTLELRSIILLADFFTLFGPYRSHSLSRKSLICS